MKIFPNSANSNSLILHIFLGVVAGAVLGFFLNTFNFEVIKILTDMLGGVFVGALKAIAPLLVFALICVSIATKEFNSHSSKGLKKIIVLYVIGTFLASICAVCASFAFPTTLVFNSTASDVGLVPTNISVVLVNLVKKAVDNPVNALASGNFISIVVWSVLAGVVLRHANENTKVLLVDISDSLSKCVGYIIQIAPYGIFGLVASSVAETGFAALAGYLHLIVVLVFCMLFVAFVLNAIIVFAVTRKNPYPLIFTCIKESAITAFFTRSSAANIPVNMALAKKLNLNENLYSVSVPLGATINMAGAAITIAVLALAAAYTMGIQVDFGMTLLLCLIASISACGTSGIAGGSLMLVPLACSLFGISNDVALQVVAIGFIIGIIQDSFETALNSSTDVLFTAAVSQSLEKDK